jgi:hypothetical protein
VSERRQFKRMVLGLPQNARDYAAVAAAANLAELLGIGLAGTFVEDATLFDIAGLPCVRELRPLEGGWRPISLTQLAREIEHTAATARRLFDKATRLCTVETSFSLVRGAAADVLAAQTTAEDILVIVEPKSPGERVTRQFTELLAAAFRAAAAVMIVPSHIARASGPIVAIAANRDDPSISAPLDIAAAADELLIIVPLSGFSSSKLLAERAAATGVRLKIAPARPRKFDQPALAGNIVSLKPRLITVSRGTLDDAGDASLASSCAVPVLVIEPDTAASAG